MLVTLGGSVILSLLAYVTCSTVIHGMQKKFVEAGMYGRDLNKSSEAKV